jgi:hypothetical protein
LVTGGGLITGGVTGGGSVDTGGSGSGWVIE